MMSRNDNKNPFESDASSGLSDWGEPTKPVRKTFTASQPYTVEERGIMSDDWGEPSKPLSPQEKLQLQKEEAMLNTRESSKSALRALYDSEQVGIATAEELLHQGEQLDRTEKNVITINSDLRKTQRSINSIKSVFGGIKNWWSGPPADTSKQPTFSSKNSSSLPTTIDNISQLSKDPPQTPLEKEQSLIRKPTGSAVREFEEELDADLDVMSDGMARLKGLASGLGCEISRQNDQLDRIGELVDRSDVKLKSQNKDMKKILGK